MSADNPPKAMLEKASVLGNLNRTIAALEALVVERTQQRDDLLNTLRESTEQTERAIAQRDQAREGAKNIVLDLINESSAMELAAWLIGPRQFQLAVLARLRNWR